MGKFSQFHLIRYDNEIFICVNIEIFQHKQDIDFFHTSFIYGKYGKEKHITGLGYKKEYYTASFTELIVISNK